MPTTKFRVNLSIPADVQRSLQKLAKRDHISITTKTLNLVYQALEIEEDAALMKIVKAREKIKGKYISHEDAWV